MIARRSAACALFVLCAGSAHLVACSSDSSPPASAPKHDPITLAFGPSAAPLTATVSQDDGSLAVKAPWAASLVGSPSGRALVAVRLDPDDPDAFHDPETTSDADFVDVAALEVVSSDATALKLHGVIPGTAGGTVDLTLAPQADGSLGIDAVTGGASVVQVQLRLASDDGAYVGFGERFDHVDAKGTVVPLSFRLGSFASGTNETHVPVPAFVSSRGYGVTVLTGEVGAADVASTDASLVRMVFEGDALHARLFAAQEPLAIVAAQTMLTGKPRLPPKWAYAPMQWRNEGVDTTKVLDDVTTTRSKKIPGGCLWIDNPWQVSYDDSTFYPDKFADPKALIDQVRGLGFEVMVWSTPYLEFAASPPADEAQQLFVEAQSKHLLVEDTSGRVFDTPVSVAGKTRVGMLDLPTDAASAWWSTQLKTVTSLGIAGFKLDFAEDLIPEFGGTRLPLVVGGAPYRETRARYPLAYHRTYRHAFSGLRDDAFILGRASSIGGQAEVDALWPGDLDNDLSTHVSPRVGGLAASVCGMINLAASGFPHYAADTGGFRGGTPTKEHLLRWAEVNAHSVIFQNGGGGTSHNPWNYDDETVTLFRALARRHMDLYPYLRALSVAASTDGTPTVRALPLAYPAERAAIGAHADDEYLLGADLLVAPVLEDGATSREVYLPTGAWTRWSTGERFVGPKALTLPAALGDTIVLVREGALIPMIAADVDTLGDATDPSVVTAKMRASVFRAYAVPWSKTRATWEDGTLLDVNGGTDKNQAIVVAFVPSSGAGSLTITLDVAGRNDFPATWSIDGATPDAAASEDAVDACTTPCAFVDPTKKRVTLHMVKGGSASGAK